MSLYEGDYIEQFFLGFLIDVDKHDKGRVPVTFVGVTVSTKGICIYNIYIYTIRSSLASSKNQMLRGY